MNFPLPIEISKSRKILWMPLNSSFSSSYAGYIKKKSLNKFTTIIQGTKVVNKPKSIMKSSELICSC